MNTIYTHDVENDMASAALVAASAAAQVSGADKIKDLGAAFYRGDLIVDVTAVEVATGDEIYEVECQFSSSATFASDVVIGSTLKLGAATPTGNSAATGTGRFILPFTNCPNGTIYRYMRVYLRVAGTIATGINYSAWIGVPIA